MKRLDAMSVRVWSLAATGPLRVAITLVLITLYSPTLLAAISLWDGGGNDDNWTTGANWFALFGPGAVPPNDGTADIVFPATGGLVQTPLVNVPYSIDSLTFGNGDGRFVILGASELTIGAGGITNNDADIQSVIGPVKLSANQTWNAAAGRLQMDALNLNGVNLNLAGAYQIDLINAIVGAGSLTVADAYTSTITMSGGVSNSYTGLTDVQGGTLLLQKSVGSTAVPGDLTIGSGAIVRLNASQQISQAAGNEVTINAGGLLDVNTNTETLARLVFSGGAASNTTDTGKLSASEIIVNAATGSWTGQLYVGDTTDGTLDISSGGEFTNGNHAYVGYELGSSGAALVNGANSTWDSGGSVYVGTRGSGSLSVTGGGHGESLGLAAAFVGPDSVGTITIEGHGSTWSVVFGVGIGWEGNGTLNVVNGGVLTNFVSQLGVQATSVGHAKVDGVGSGWTTSNVLFVGLRGCGTLEVTGGGQIESEIGVIADSAGSTGEVTVDGADSSWTNSDELNVGFTGNGTLSIVNGGTVSSTIGNIGVLSGSVGQVSISGIGSTWHNSTDIHIGQSGAGSLSVTDSGEVEATNFIVGPLGNVHGDGKLVGDVQNGGLVGPGTSTPVLYIDGNYSQETTGELLIELAADTNYDQLSVTGNVELNGSLRVELLGFYVPGVGDEFDILHFAALTGEFSMLDFPPLPNDMEWDTARLYSDGILAVTGPAVGFGDYNLDGFVDAADYVVWRKATLGSLVDPYTDADGNGNGVIDLDDYSVWRKNFGDTIGSGAGSSNAPTHAVPEPATSVLLMLAATSWCLCRGRAA